MAMFPCSLKPLGGTHVFSGLRLPRLRILVAVLHQLLRLTHQLHHQVNLFLCRTTTLWHRHFQELSRTRFLWDYSGGNTNMAATTGSFISVVVPSFISTYSTLGGPSVVSTLPASSAEPLPVGGSCGGAIASVSSTFPSLYKAFVVGPGYAPVPYKIVSKIMAGLFVDLADLQPDNIRAQEIESQAFLEGKLVVSGSKKRVVEIADIVTWIEAFTIFCMILCHTFPSRWKDLNQYSLFRQQGASLTRVMAQLRHRLQKGGSSHGLYRLVSHEPRPLQFSHQISGYHFSCLRLITCFCLVTSKASDVFEQSSI